MISLLRQGHGNIYLEDLKNSGHSINAAHIMITRDSAMNVAVMFTHYHYQHKATSLMTLISPKMTVTLNFTGD